eukprot:TRINITY_DN953_c0_g1_i4.p1 TRINITY_DN953_c0_g1~~TRINITY_DN953_c0_g1_i4.p1  ORF type:complete len:576 (-),score=126.08 TRINITY_DN953_c0_g1_i4:669-2396(-)
MAKVQALRPLTDNEMDVLSASMYYHLPKKDRFVDGSLYRNSFTGEQAVDFMVKALNLTSRADSVFLGHQVLQKGIIFCLFPGHPFVDSPDALFTFNSVWEKRNIPANGNNPQAAGIPPQDAFPTPLHPSENGSYSKALPSMVKNFDMGSAPTTPGFSAAGESDSTPSSSGNSQTPNSINILMSPSYPVPNSANNEYDEFTSSVPVNPNNPQSSVNNQVPQLPPPPHHVHTHHSSKSKSNGTMVKSNSNPGSLSNSPVNQHNNFVHTSPTNSSGSNSHHGAHDLYSNDTSMSESPPSSPTENKKKRKISKISNSMSAEEKLEQRAEKSRNASRLYRQRRKQYMEEVKQQLDEAAAERNKLLGEIQKQQSLLKKVTEENSRLKLDQTIDIGKVKSQRRSLLHELETLMSQESQDQRIESIIKQIELLNKSTSKFSLNHVNDLICNDFISSFITHDETTRSIVSFPCDTAGNLQTLSKRVFDFLPNLSHEQQHSITCIVQQYSVQIDKCKSQRQQLNNEIENQFHSESSNSSGGGGVKGYDVMEMSKVMSKLRDSFDTESKFWDSAINEILGYVCFLV